MSCTGTGHREGYEPGRNSRVSVPGAFLRSFGLAVVLGLFLSPTAAPLLPAAGDASESLDVFVGLGAGEPGPSGPTTFALCGWRLAPTQLSCNMEVIALPDYLVVFVQHPFVGTVKLLIRDVWSSWFRADCHVETFTNPILSVCTTDGPGVFANSPTYFIDVSSTTYSRGWYNGGAGYD